jgi:hypothetical protein
LSTFLLLQIAARSILLIQIQYHLVLNYETQMDSKYVPFFVILHMLFFLQVCCLSKDACSMNETAWVPTPASTIPGESLTIDLAVPNSCTGKSIHGLRYLWRETPCLFKEAAVYNSKDSNLPAGPYIHFF